MVRKAVMVLGLAGIFLYGFESARAGEYVKYSNPRRYHVRHTGCSYNKNITTMSSLELNIPMPQQWPDCKVSNLKVSGNSPIHLVNTEGPGQLYRYFSRDGVPRKGDTVFVRLEYDILLYEVNIDLEKLSQKTYPEYAENAEYQYYTRLYAGFNDGDSETGPLIKELRDKSNGNPVLYAKAVYDWVGTNIKYGPNLADDTKTRWRQRQGDCGGIGDIFVALCRAGGVPARFVAGCWAGGIDGWHCWAEFCVPVEGWIPIDHSPAGGFGHLSNNHLPLAKTGAMKFKFDGDKGTKDCGFIQPGYWFFWFGGGGEGGAIDTEFAVESFPYTDMPKMASKTEIQNAFSEAKQKMARKDYGRALQIYQALMVSDGCEEKDKGLLKCELARCYLKRNQRVKAAMELLPIIENDSNSILASRAIDLLKVIRREEVNLSSLNIERIRQGWGGPQRDKSVEGKEISIGGQKFKNGVGTHAESVCVIQTNGSVENFSSLVGVDDETGNRGSVEFWVIGDGEVLWKSGVMKGGEKAKPVKVPVGGVKELILKVTGTEDGGVCDHADWADAKLLINGFYPAIIVPQN